MRQEQMKVQLFRLIDVLPALDDPREVARHARDYLADLRCPGYSAWASMPAPCSQASWPSPRRFGVRQMANNFILAPDAAAAIPKLRRLRDNRLTFTADILGETVLSEKEAEQYQDRYLRLIADWPMPPTPGPTSPSSIPMPRRDPEGQRLG